MGVQVIPANLADLISHPSISYISTAIDKPFLLRIFGPDVSKMKI
jgi:hypothetical protein